MLREASRAEAASNQVGQPDDEELDEGLAILAQTVQDTAAASRDIPAHEHVV